MQTITVDLSTFTPINKNGVEKESFTCSFSTPANYDHAVYVENNLKNLAEICDPRSHKVDFAKRTEALLPGTTYLLRIFPIKGCVTSKTLHTFLIKEKAIFCGMHALTLLAKEHSEVFIKDAWMFSFDNSKEVPSMIRCNDNHLRVTFNEEDCDWVGGYNLICVTKHE